MRSITVPLELTVRLVADARLFKLVRIVKPTHQDCSTPIHRSVSVDEQVTAITLSPLRFRYSGDADRQLAILRVSSPSWLRRT